MGDSQVSVRIWRSLQQPQQWSRERQMFSDSQVMVYVRISLEARLESNVQVVPEQTVLHHIPDYVNPATNLKQTGSNFQGVLC